jgi:hypothetical protein
LEFKILYLKKAPIAKNIKIAESIIPNNKSDILNIWAIDGLLKLYVISII